MERTDKYLTVTEARPGGATYGATHRYAHPSTEITVPAGWTDDDVLAAANNLVLAIQRDQRKENA